MRRAPYSVQVGINDFAFTTYEGLDVLKAFTACKRQFNRKTSVVM